MRRRVLLLTLLVMTAGALILGIAVSLHPAPPNAATVDDRPVTERSIDLEVAEIRRNPPYVEVLQAQGPTDGSMSAGSSLGRQVLTRRIYGEIVSEELHRRGLAVGPAELTRGHDEVVAELGHDFTTGGSDGARGEGLLAGFSPTYRVLLVRRAAERAAVEDAVTGLRVDDEAVRRYEAMNPDEFTEVCARHVVLATRAEADEVAAQLRGGADFAALATQRSTDGLTAGLGGDIGCASPARYPPELASALRTQPIGEIGVPVQTFLGWHVVQVSRRTVQSAADAGPGIRAKLADQQRQKFDTWLEEHAKGSKIQVSSRWGRFDTRLPLPQVR